MTKAMGIPRNNKKNEQSAPQDSDGNRVHFSLPESFPIELTRSNRSSSQSRKPPIETSSLKGYWGILSMSETVFSPMPSKKPLPDDDGNNEKAEQGGEDLAEGSNPWR